MSRMSELFVVLASVEESADTYSSVLRELNKEDDTEKRKRFMKKFKDAFDKAIDKDPDNHQEIALVSAKKSIAHSSERFVKLAQVAVGISNNPNEVGKTVADIVKVILARVPHDRIATYNTMRNKIMNINVAEISGTQLPDTATYGQAITLIKTLLSGYNPEFVKQVLTSAANYLY